MKDYKSLPIVVSTSLFHSNLGTGRFLPSISALQEYLKPIDGLTDFTSFSYSGWQEFEDPAILRNISGDGDIEEFIKLFPSFDATKRAPNEVARLVSSEEIIGFSVDMSPPRRDEMISVDDVEKLIRDKYYISFVDYRYNYRIVIEGKESAIDLRWAISNFLRDKKIDDNDIKVLDYSQLYYCLRTSSSEYAIMEQANGLEEIVSLVGRMEKEIEQISCKYPISFRLRNVRDLERYRYVYTNEWYERIKS